MKTGSLLLRDLREWPESEARDMLAEYTRYVQADTLNRLLSGTQARCTCVADQCAALLRALEGERLAVAEVRAMQAQAPEHVMVEPPPHHPPRCTECGFIEANHYSYLRHPFTPQPPWCHRAHPHGDPCAPKPATYVERERQAKAEARGWDSVDGGGALMRPYREFGRSR